MAQLVYRHCLSHMFCWNSEGLWSEQSGYWLPSLNKIRILKVKPDFVMIFTRDSFTPRGLFGIDEKLIQLICPDNNRGKRCFPFLFFETNKIDAPLEEAYDTNMHHFSQALYNIYAWMKSARLEETFLKKCAYFRWY